jgi:uncharacterized membrane protein
MQLAITIHDCYTGAMSNVLISILSGLGGMFGWGTADFFATKVIREIGNLRALFWVQTVGIATISLLILVFRPELNTDATLILLSAVCGVLYIIGYLLLYQSFGIGKLSIVSPIAASQTPLAVLIAVLFLNQTLVNLQPIGIGLVMIGVLFLSIDLQEIRNAQKVEIVKGVKEALGAAIAFGIFWPISDYVNERMHWLWFNLVAKFVGFILLLIWAKLSSPQTRMAEVGKITKYAVLVALLDLGALLSISYGLSVGDSIIIVPISQAVPLVTITLAVLFLKEKLKLNQVIGIVLTIIGIILTAIS